MNGSIDASKAGNGTITLNSTDLAYQTDWRVKNSETIELLGNACNEYLDSSDVTLKASFPCDAFDADDSNNGGDGDGTFIDF